MKKTNTKKIAAIGIAAGVIIGGIGAAVGGIVADDSKTVDELSILISAQEAKLEAKQAELDSIEPVVINNTIEKEVVIEKIVKVDNGNLSVVLDSIWDNDGNVEYLLDDLDEEDIKEIVERISFENESKVLAERLVKADIVEYIDDEEDMFGEGDLEEYRDNDVYRVTIDEDDTVFEIEDYDDKEATVFVRAKLKLDNDDDKETQYVIAEVEVEDGKLEIVDVVLD